MFIFIKIIFLFFLLTFNALTYNDINFITVNKGERTLSILNDGEVLKKFSISLLSIIII